MASKFNEFKSDSKVALITGVTGQDGSYLAELLLKKGYCVVGIMRRSSSFNTKRVDHLFGPKYRDNMHFVYGDMTDSTNLAKVVAHYQPDEIYNLAAQSNVKISFEIPEYTGQVDAIGTLRLLEALRSCKLEKKTKFYQASTSELYGKVQETPQTETTPFYPRSPYGVAKLYGFWILKNYREAYNIYCCNGILFNHESPRRGGRFVTRKITREVAKIKFGLGTTLTLGNMYSKRDWGHARDYVEGMWLMLQQDKPEDFVLATGETHSVKEFVVRAFNLVGIDLTWSGEGVDEKGVDKDRVVRVQISKNYFRPTEVDLLLGDATKAKKKLGWTPKITFKTLVLEMLSADLEAFRSEAKQNKDFIIAE